MLRRVVDRKERTIQFIGEQDGKPERDLKTALYQTFRHIGSVQSAYLARVRYGNMAVAVALALKAQQQDRATIVTTIASVFASMFGSDQHLDILFLSEDQERELERVCEPFFQRER